MDLALWIIQIVLALAFLAAGATKLARRKEDLVDRMGWVETWSPQGVRAVGLVEVLAAVGLVGPAATGVLPVLTPLAALGLVLVMAGASVVHVRRGELRQVPVNLVLGAASAFVAWGRLGGAGL